MVIFSADYGAENSLVTWLAHAARFERVDRFAEANNIIQIKRAVPVELQVVGV